MHFKFNPAEYYWRSSTQYKANARADFSSRINIVEKENLFRELDYEALSKSQSQDIQIKNILNSKNNKLKLEWLKTPFSSTSVLCDVSTGSSRPILPLSFRKQVFDLMYSFSHPGIKASIHLIKQ